MGVNNWIRVSEQLPKWVEETTHGYKASEPVLLLLPENGMTIGRYIHDSTGEEYWLNDIGDFVYRVGLVTHWHELPEPPEKQFI